MSEKELIAYELGASMQTKNALGFALLLRVVMLLGSEIRRLNGWKE